MAKTYKILSQKDKWFTGKFDPLRLEEALNAYASLHWRVSTSVTATFPGLMTKREELIAILERDEFGGSMFEYKILSQKDKWFTGKFDPDKLEQAINSYAAQGWSVRHAVTATIPGITSSREEMVIILERPTQG